MVKKMPTSWHERETWWRQWALIFLWMSTWSWHPPIFMHPPEPELPLCGRHK